LSITPYYGKVVGFTMSSYDVECEGCSKEVTITGGYIGKLEDVWCEDCGYEGEIAAALEIPPLMSWDEIKEKTAVLENKAILQMLIDAAEANPRWAVQYQASATYLLKEGLV
jgi:hypothetical protein